MAGHSSSPRPYICSVYLALGQYISDCSSQVDEFSAIPATMLSNYGHRSKYEVGQFSGLMYVCHSPRMCRLIGRGGVRVCGDKKLMTFLAFYIDLAYRIELARSIVRCKQTN